MKNESIDDWKSLHRIFYKQFQKINLYLNKYVNLFDKAFYLVYSQTNAREDDILLDFNIAVEIGDGNLSIIRDISITLSPLLFVAYTSQCGLKDCTNITSCLSFFRKLKNKSVIQITNTYKKNHIFSFILNETLSVADDIGASRMRFEDLSRLSDVEIPPLYTDRTYSAVGIKYHAPYSVSEIECILFAQKNNIYDNNAIEIRRWFPFEKQKGGPIVFPYSYSYGFISKTENTELHKFMVENECRVLFGKVSDGKVTILGTASVFKTLLSSYNFPSFLVKYIK